ncbi:MAG: DNA adenine methylase [Dehalococcoidales bacterium]
MSKEADVMKITAIAPWFGGKRNLAPKIVEMLGEHRVYWEPFCGSMAVLFAKPTCVMETVCDLHGGLTNLARVVQDRELGLQLYEMTAKTLMCEQLFKEAAERIKSGDYQTGHGNLNLDWAYDFMLCNWLGRNGVAGTKSYNYALCVRYTANGGHAAKRWRSVVESIPAWQWRLMNVTILNRDAFEVLERIEDKAGTAIYIDPPYFKKGAQYVHDFEAEDHQRLADSLARFRESRVVVSYYDNPRIDELYPGWDRKKMEVSKAMANQCSRGTKDVKATEVLLCNQAIEKEAEVPTLWQ